LKFRCKERRENPKGTTKATTAANPKQREIEERKNSSKIHSGI